MTGLLSGAGGTRTPDPHNAIVVLSQLSYSPKGDAIGLPGFGFVCFRSGQARWS